MGIFYLCGSCDLDLDPMTFIYEPYPYPRICEYKLPIRQTDMTEIIYYAALRVVNNMDWRFRNQLITPKK